MNGKYTRNMAIRILEWMACSFRTLKTYEILDGIAIRPECTTLSRRTKLDKAVLDHCRPLIEDGPSNTIDFVHFSAKEWVHIIYPIQFFADLPRYILQGEYRDTKAFIQIEQAYFNISFSCVSYLNTCLNLLPTISTDLERTTIIVEGIHHLQLYANQFWYRHLLAYAAVCARRRISFSADLLLQLSSLLRFSKNSTARSAQVLNPGQIPGLQILDQVPAIKELVSKIISFRESLKKDEWNDKSPQSKPNYLNPIPGTS